MNKTYYLYRHIREDKDEVFYVGVGTYNPKGIFKHTKYKRAFKEVKGKGCRNKYWQNITRKTNYIVEIIFSSNSLDEIFNKEIEFIKLYGRKDLKEGTLCNLDDGGRGKQRPVISSFRREKLRKNSWVKGKFGASHHLSKPVFVYSIEGVFMKSYGGYREASLDLKIDRANIGLIINGACQQCYGMVFKNEYLGERIPPVIIKDEKKRMVARCNQLGNILEEFNSVSEAANSVGSSTSNISHACKKPLSKVCKGFRWKYLN